MHRRTFLKLAGGVSLGAMMPDPCVLGEDAPRVLVPTDKGFSATWWDALTQRGEPEVYRGEELRHIGMPVGGLCAGLVYLGGDGKPWLWDIFNRNTFEKKVSYAGQTFGNRNGSAYVEPMAPASPFAQGFAIKYKSGSTSGERTLDRDGGWADLSFQGPYPLATVRYRDPAVPLTVELAAFSPFIPLNFDDSSLPATVFRYTVANASQAPVEVELGGWLENVVLAFSSAGEAVARENRPFEDADGRGVLLSARLADAGSPPVPATKRHDFGTLALRAVAPAPTAGSVAECLPPGENPAKVVFGAPADAPAAGRPVAAVRQAFTLAPGEHRTVDFVLAWHFPNVDPRINGPDVIQLLHRARFAGRRRGRALCRGQFRPAQRRNENLGGNLERFHAAALVSRPHVQQPLQSGDDDELPFRQRPILGLGRHLQLRGHLHPRLGLRAGDGADFPRTGARPAREDRLRLRTRPARRHHPTFAARTAALRQTGRRASSCGRTGSTRCRRTIRSCEPLWPRVRLAMDRLITQANDKGPAGRPAAQHARHGVVRRGRLDQRPVSGGVARGRGNGPKVCGDADYAAHCRQLFDLGARSLVPELFNGEYFINKVDRGHLDAINSGTRLRDRPGDGAKLGLAGRPGPDFSARGNAHRPALAVALQLHARTRAATICR